ncbi:hypothetical protein KH5_15480 [Urechidicola sp. KH5]
MKINIVSQLFLAFLLSVFSNYSSAQVLDACSLNKDSKTAINKLVEFNFRACNLDVSKDTYLAFDIQNNSGKQIIVDLKYRGPRKHLENQGRYFVDNGAKETLKLILYRKKLDSLSDWEKDFSKVRALPGNYVRHWNAFDLKQIKSVVVSIKSNEGVIAQNSVFITKPKGLEPLDFFNKKFADEALPFLDEMGQYANSSWEGKLNSKSDLALQGKTDLKTFKKSSFSKDRSKFGGFLNGPQLEAKGYFYTAKHKGKWWFVDPEGYLFWSQGVTGAGIGSATSSENRKHLFPDFSIEKASNWKLFEDSFKRNNINFYTLNLKRKYGENWEDQHRLVTSGRLKSWGINTYGAWSKTEKGQQHPYTLIIHPSKQGIGKIEKMVDPFSEDFYTDLQQRVSRLKHYKNDPWLLGVFVNNELHWGNEMSIPIQVLNLKKSIPARAEMIRLLKKKYKKIDALNKAWNVNFDSFKTIKGPGKQKFTDAFYTDMHTYFEHFTTAYFKTVQEELEAVLPNHLYFGSRFHGNVKNNTRIHKVASRYCDVISFNIYEYSVKGFKVYTEIDKPAIIGEFHFGTGSHGVWGVGLRSATDLKNQALLYEQYMQDAVNHPQFIGAHWFQWSDQPATGRGGDGENFRIGLVSITDQPYENMTEVISKAAKSILKTRLIQE